MRGAFFQKAGEAAGQNFAHHAVIVAGDEVFGLDVELAVLAFRKPFRTRDDHATNGIGPHDVGVVVDFYTARGRAQFEGFRDALQQTGLAGRFRQTPPKRFACIRQGMIDQILFFTAPGHCDIHLPGCALAQRLGQQVLFGEPMRKEDLLRGGFVVIELGQKTLQHFRFAEGLVCFRKIGPVAPVLTGSEEKDLYAGLAALLMNGKDISFLNRLRVDPLIVPEREDRADSLSPVDRLRVRIPDPQRQLPFARQAAS